MTFSITPDRFPFLFRDKTIDPKKMEVFVRVTFPSASAMAGSDIKLALVTCL